MQTLQSISNSSGKPVILLPLTTIILITAIKDLYEDWKRHRSDSEENHKKILLGSNFTFREEKWENVKVGTLIKVCENEYFPADFLLIRSSDPKGFFIYIEKSQSFYFTKEFALLKQRILMEKRI